MFSKNKKQFNQILNKIKSVKIQGATNIAKASIKAYFLVPGKSSQNKLLKSRPTEPMMENVLDLAESGRSEKEILEHFSFAQDKINKYVNKLVKNNDVIFTHCHSTNVVKALIYVKKQKRKFQVYNTETRPLYQGRRTAKELGRAKIKTTMFVDSALGIALAKEQGTKSVDKVFLGADAITKEGIVNKVGSEVVARLAREEKIPVYVIADSWKYSKHKIPTENRKLNEVWDKAPKNIKLRNPAFEFMPKKYIKSIISEYGILSYSDFIKKVK